MWAVDHWVGPQIFYAARAHLDIPIHMVLSPGRLHSEVPSGSAIYIHIPCRKILCKVARGAPSDDLIRGNVKNHLLWDWISNLGANPMSFTLSSVAPKFNGFYMKILTLDQ